MSLVMTVMAGAAIGQTTTRVSVDSAGVQGNGEGYISSISADGRWVAFESTSSNLVPGDTNGRQDIFVHDRSNGVTERASISSSSVEGDNGSRFPSLSADGRYVAFLSGATNFAPGANGCEHVYLRDCQAGTIERISVNSAGVPANADSHYPSVSADGRYVAFWSWATNLSPNDPNSLYDVYVRDRLSNTTELVSVSSTGVLGNGFSYWCRISANGRFVTFMSDASNLTPSDTNGRTDIFVRDLQTGTTECVSLGLSGTLADSESYFPAISADGRFVTFMSSAANLVASDTNNSEDIFTTDRLTGSTIRVSVDSAGAQANGGSAIPSISADGRYIVFYSLASNLVPGDGNGVADVFIHDTQLGATERVSVDSSGAEANGESGRAYVSSDGRYVSYCSTAANLVAGDTNGVFDIFVRDRGPDFGVTPFCFGDGTDSPCPCSNTGQAGHGCDNSISTGGALLVGTGDSLLLADTLVLTASNERPTALSLFWQGGSEIAPRPFGDGVGCMGSPLKRMYWHNAVGGAVSVPQGADLPVSVRSAALGDPIAPGSIRVYHVFYRDPSVSFCPLPLGSSFNTTNGLRVLWGG